MSIGIYYRFVMFVVILILMILCISGHFCVYVVAWATANSVATWEILVFSLGTECFSWITIIIAPPSQNKGKWLSSMLHELVYGVYESGCPPCQSSNFRIWEHCPKLGHGYENSPFYIWKLWFQINLSIIFHRLKGCPLVNPWNIKRTIIRWWTKEDHIFLSVSL